jgi:hypothetical protein|nr:hypothetical protein [Kofleriaceae bacterium]
MRTSSLAIASLVSLAAAAGCMNRGTGTSDLDSPAAAVDSSDSTEAEGNMMMASVDGADVSGAGALTDTQVAAAISANVSARWNPSGCATVVQTGADVAITYDDCTGPHGLLHVTGELDLVITISSANLVQVAATSTGLKVNGADLDITASATYSVSASAHVLTVQTQGSGVGALGNEIDHQGNYTVSWDPTSECGSIDGMWSTELTTPNASATRSNDVDLQRCAGGCPTGSLVHHFLGGQTLTLTFDGTSVAAWATSGGNSGTVNLACQ